MVAVKPRSEKSAQRREALAYGGALVGAVIFLAFYSVQSSTLIYTVTPEKIVVGSQLIVQLDSFLTGGWIVGFFYYWSGWEKALRASKKARLKMRPPDFPARQFNSASDVMLYAKMVRQEKTLQPTSFMFVGMISGVLMFILSAMAAVNAVFTSSGLLVILASTTMAGGVVLMILSWFLLRSITQRLRELTDLVELR